ncbi:MAG: hypothetical protein AABW49_02390 [Nanoarchaeota archaeon]
MQKKGEISIVFKYALVLVSGIIILAFFIGFAFNIQRTGEKLQATEVRETLNDYLVALSSSSYNLQTPADLKIKTRLSFNTPICQHFIVQQLNGVSAPAEYSHIIYAPRSLFGKSLEVWKMGWFYPYYITNFFFITNKRTKVVLVGDQEFIIELLDEIPPNLNVGIGNSVNIKDYADDSKNYEHVKIIAFSNVQPQEQDNVQLISIKPFESSCRTQVDGTDKFKCHGTIAFPSGAAEFYGKTMMYGAFFTDHVTDYECNFEAAEKQLKLVSAVYGNKQLLLRSKLSGCGLYNLGFDWSQDGAGWNEKATSLYSANDHLGSRRDCAYVF